MYEYEGVRGQRDELRRDLEERDEEIRRLQAQVKELQDSYQSLKPPRCSKSMTETWKSRNGE